MTRLTLDLFKAIFAAFGVMCLLAVVVALIWASGALE